MAAHKNVSFFGLRAHIICGIFCATLIFPNLAFHNIAFADVRASIQSKLTNNKIKWRQATINIANIKNYYKTNIPLWTNEKGLNSKANDLLDLLLRADEDGLLANNYLEAFKGNWKRPRTSDDIAGAELALSQAFIEFSRDLYSGRTTPAVTNPNIVIKRKKYSAAKWLNAAKKNGPRRHFQSVRPPHPQYNELRKMLAGYRSISALGGWPTISKGATLKPKMETPRVAEMRRNLLARGYSGVKSNQPNIYDQNLVDVVKHFQRRHGLAVDGVVGSSTIAALNITAKQRVQQIIVNMERWRWMPRSLGKRHLLVNLPAFEMFLREERRILDRRKVIIGKAYNKTPMFSDKIIYAEFNPTWTVPSKIAGEEILPKLRKDPSYLNKHNYKLYDSWKNKAPEIDPYSVDWNAVSAKKFPYRVVQQPGRGNALGDVKFIFPNRFNIYLHDTPSKNLFAKSNRAFSHGCIRVHRPLEFAAKLFAPYGEISRGDMKAVVDSKHRTRINLDKPLPVHLTYFTVWIDPDGTPLFFNDIYKRDNLVKKHLTS
jgi:murein L,D-transpeptidase YcbB/YkuD